MTCRIVKNYHVRKKIEMGCDKVLKVFEKICINKKRKGTTGVEPVTSRSAVECSATELYPQSYMTGNTIQYNTIQSK